ncbi:MAG TPA: glycosyltransferase [Usitatibacter sp.]|nr:glycosyltransferase [Usitatibacter sp.]
MRVLFIISELTLGGAQKQVVELARQLVRHGHDAAIYTLNHEVPRAKELAGSGVALVVDQKRWKVDPAVLRRLRRYLRDWRPDIVHGFLFDGDIYARIAAFATGIPVLNSERSDNYTLSRVQYLGHRLTRALADGLVANSHSGSAFAQRLYGFQPERCHVVWNGLRIEELERQAATRADYRAEFFGPGKHKLACLVGAIKPAKDYHLAIDAAARLVRADPGWRVLFVGDQLANATYRAGVHSDTGEYKQSVMRHFAEQEIGDKVRFAGARSDAPAIVAQSDVLYVTSCREGFPNVVLEAMVLGVPVVSTDYSDIRRILPRPEQVVASRRPDDLAWAILDAYGERDAIAKEQRRWVRTHASIENATLELERVYQRYLRTHALARAA